MITTAIPHCSFIHFNDPPRSGVLLEKMYYETTNSFNC